VSATTYQPLAFIDSDGLRPQPAPSDPKAGNAVDQAGRYDYNSPENWLWFGSSDPLMNEAGGVQYRKSFDAGNTDPETYWALRDAGQVEKAEAGQGKSNAFINWGLIEEVNRQVNWNWSGAAWNNTEGVRDFIGEGAAAVYNTSADIVQGAIGWLAKAIGVDLQTLIRILLWGAVAVVLVALFLRTKGAAPVAGPRKPAPRKPATDPLPAV
jgi:hypothetical protein